ncbi:23S rRNA (adenine(2030)-N(6))-methyltransferase RlmJ [Burkholderiaceae bacterium FT117]|uniref:23S rRNA (adenine(2030)-N(6))-methyltransferase RlmJ n=1 Tax=Zeimonas sediminis TaxID=2944268 RepID=UPI002342DF0F|nr:23S rRNA (adenine(2030)-N(6))-methyltransferase RlmJ [Zeimonas sediminis]MCM5570130.1 23S rRNA (adenine(2030)-N(6))-methyltransferase RlmJ [Zeimonas sediminis]
MFSYRHAFHAGNHADVLKHVVLVQLLRHLALKETPFWVIDTHAGAGLYSLEGEWAAKRSEFADGIGRLWGRADAPPAVADYLDEVRAVNPEGRLRHYPGSPFIALRHLRDRDRLRLFEMHPNESRVLAGNIEEAGRDAQRRTIVSPGDGFAGLKALLPPPPRRALVLIDPSYEDKRDYARALAALREGLERFATGCYAIWYPLVQRPEPADLARRLTNQPGIRWLHVTLAVRHPAADGLGLHGSGMFVVNPPWTLHESLRACLPWLTAALRQDDGARHSLEQGGEGSPAQPVQSARPPRPARPARTKAPVRR